MGPKPSATTGGWGHSRTKSDVMLRGNRGSAKASAEDLVAMATRWGVGNARSLEVRIDSDTSIKTVLRSRFTHHTSSPARIIIPRKHKSTAGRTHYGLSPYVSKLRPSSEL